MTNLKNYENFIKQFCLKIIFRIHKPSNKNQETKIYYNLLKSSTFLYIYFLNINILRMYNQYVCDPESAKEAARRLFEKYSYNKTQLGQYQISAMMRDVYANINKNYNPNNEDVKGFHRGLDANRDGRVTLEDLQLKAIKYLCGLDTIPQKKYTQTVRTNLSLAKRLFEKYQNPMDHTITEKEVPAVLTETYQIMGRKGYQPTIQDVRVWMKLCDSNGDGKVIYEQYQQFVIRSLQRAGIKLFEE